MRNFPSKLSDIKTDIGPYFNSKAFKNKKWPILPPKGENSREGPFWAVLGDRGNFRALGEVWEGRAGGVLGEKRKKATTERPSCRFPNLIYYLFCADTTNSYNCLLQLRFLTILLSIHENPASFIISTYISSTGTVFP